MARRAITAALTAAVFFTIGVVLAQTGVDEKTPPVDVIGTVTAVSQDEMTVRTDQNQDWKFKLNDQTQRLAGVVVGDRVRVRYRDEFGTDQALNVSRASDTTTTTARTITTTQPPDTGLYVEGTIVTVSPTELVIRTDAGERKTFVVTSGMDRTSFREGNRVRLNYSLEGDRMMARNVAPLSATSSDSYTVASNTSTDMPHTASWLPLVALFGFLSLLAGSVLVLGRGRLI